MHKLLFLILSSEHNLHLLGHYFLLNVYKRFNESFCYNIQLEVKNYTNIYDSLKNYFKIEIMTGDNKINYEECSTKEFDISN